MATLFLILNWILFLLIFMMAGHFFRLAFLVGVRRRDDLVRSWKGEPLPASNGMVKRYVVLNLLAAIALLADGLATVLIGLPMQVWSMTGGLVLWLYFTSLHLMGWRARQAARNGSQA